MAGELAGKRVAILVTSGFEEAQLIGPRRALDNAGALMVLVSSKKESVRSWRNTDWGANFTVDVPLLEARADDFDALLLPGGVINADFLRIDPYAIGFVRDFAAAGKPVGALGHAPWLLIEAGAVRGQRMTSYPSLKTDLEAQGAEWTDVPVAVDGRLVTSRGHHDLGEFNDALVEAVAKGILDPWGSTAAFVDKLGREGLP